MTQLTAYLQFDGQCREALTFYKDCLGGELYMQKVAESPMAAQSSSQASANILHGHLSKNGVIIMMATDISANRLRPGNTVSLCLSSSSMDEINKYFGKLSLGGVIKMP